MSVENEKEIQQLKNRIRELADNESCIIIGRCADYVLKDHDNCVHVFGRWNGK